MNTVLIILAIMFWVLLALSVVCLMVWSYIPVCYLKWSREDRERESAIQSVQDTIKEKLEELKNDPAIEEEQYASDFEDDAEYTD